MCRGKRVQAFSNMSLVGYRFPGPFTGAGGLCSCKFAGLLRAFNKQIHTVNKPGIGNHRHGSHHIPVSSEHQSLCLRSQKLS